MNDLHMEPYGSHDNSQKERQDSLFKDCELFFLDCKQFGICKQQEQVVM